MKKLKDLVMYVVLACVVLVVCFGMCFITNKVFAKETHKEPRTVVVTEFELTEKRLTHRKNKERIVEVLNGRAIGSHTFKSEKGSIVTLRKHKYHLGDKLVVYMVYNTHTNYADDVVEMYVNYR